VRYIQTISTTLAVCMMAALVACSSGSSSSTGGGGGGTTPISVALTGAPSSLGPNGTASITATVSNDSAAKGVTWSCTPASSCGAFNPTATASGTATTYTAPGAAGSVVVTATSVSDTTKTASATISIAVTQITLADGNYVYALSGFDANQNPYTLDGVFTVASGKISAGEQDFVDDTNGDLHDAINPTGSGYTTTTDGNLQITLVTCAGSTCTSVDNLIGPGGNGMETINGSMVSSTRARLIGYDTFATSSGTLDAQDTTAAATTPAGPYIFTAGGYEGIAGGGILNFSGATVSTTGTVVDLNQAGTIELGQTISAGSVQAPDASGRLLVQVTLTDVNTTVINIVGYIVDASRVQVEAATIPIGGTAYAQNTSNLGVSGNSYVYGALGADGIGLFQSAGILTMGSATVTGTISTNDLANYNVPSTAITAGTYVADTTNLGRYTLTGVTNGVVTFNIQLYVDGNGNALMLTADTTDELAGPAFQQTASATMSGTYVMNDTGADGTNEDELDAVGPVTTGTGTFSGFADLNWLNTGTSGTQTADLTVTGAFTAPSGGVSTGTGNTITGLDVTTAANADAFDYYVVDSTRVIALDVDANLSQLDLAFFEVTQ
jgi:hypothetical protein